MYERALLYSFHFTSCLKVLYFFLLKLNPPFTHHSLSFIPLSFVFVFSIPHAIYTYYSRHPKTFAVVYACESEGNLKERQIKMKQIPLGTPSILFTL